MDRVIQLSVSKGLNMYYRLNTDYHSDFHIRHCKKNSGYPSDTRF